MSVELVIIRAVHLFIVLFMTFGVFCNDKSIIGVHTIMALNLLVHWFLNDNTCALTIIENKLTETNKEESFIHKIVSPIYDIGDTNKIVTIITLFLYGFSSYKYGGLMNNV